MYAFGITLFEVFACAEPYADQPDALSVLTRVADTAASPPFRPALPPHTPPLFRELCRRCWHPEAAARPSFAQIAIEIKTLDMPELSRALLITRQGHKRSAEGDGLQDRQASLIQKVFPARVAAQLLDSKQVEPEAVDCVTIFFSCARARSTPAFKRVRTAFDRCVCAGASSVRFSLGTVRRLTARVRACPSAGTLWGSRTWRPGWPRRRSWTCWWAPLPAFTLPYPQRASPSPAPALQPPSGACTDAPL